MAGISNLSASVHKQYNGKLSEFDHVEKILHTVNFTDKEGLNRTIDIMATDPIDAIERVRNHYPR